MLQEARSAIRDPAALRRAPNAFIAQLRSDTSSSNIFAGDAGAHLLNRMLAWEPAARNGGGVESGAPAPAATRRSGGSRSRSRRLGLRSSRLPSELQPGSPPQSPACPAAGPSALALADNGLRRQQPPRIATRLEASRVADGVVQHVPTALYDECFDRVFYALVFVLVLLEWFDRA